jgi:hypothetical protein
MGAAEDLSAIFFPSHTLQWLAIRPQSEIGSGGARWGAVAHLPVTAIAAEEL